MWRGRRRWQRRIVDKSADEQEGEETHTLQGRRTEEEYGYVQAQEESEGQLPLLAGEEEPHPNLPVFQTTF